MIHHRNFIKYRAEYNEIASPDNYLYLINFISSAYLSYFDKNKNKTAGNTALYTSISKQ